MREIEYIFLDLVDWKSYLGLVPTDIPRNKRVKIGSNLMISYDDKIISMPRSAACAQAIERTLLLRMRRVRYEKITP